MKKVFFRRDNVELFLDNEPFASGGEGNLYRIRRPAKYNRFVVKLYHQDKRTSARQRKVEYMITNPPVDYTLQGHYPLIWPLGSVYERSGFAGFMMPLAQGEKLEILCMPRIHRNLKARWGRFDFSAPEAMKKRLSICYNIATAVYQVHATDHYVLVDLKTDNIIIQPNGLVSIVDMDSVEIIDNNRVLFPATVTTPEYTPPEYYSKNVQPGKVPIFESWDLFSLTVIFYKLLFGIHPFAGSCNPPYDRFVSLHQKIEQGLFVHSPTKRQYFKVVPPPHRKFGTVNSAVQSLFLRCFEDGHENPELRPVADEWLWAIAPTPRLSIDRKLPSRTMNVGQVSYSKPLQLATDTTQMLPSIPSKRLPSTVQQTDFTTSLAIPRGIAGGTVGLFLLWMFAFGISGSASGFIQIATFLATSMGMMYAYFREIPEKKAKSLAERKLKRLRAERKDADKEIKQMKSQIAKLPNSQQVQAKNFEKIQKQNLIEEKRKIEILIRNLRKFLNEQDKEARDLLMQESKKVQELQKALFGDTYIKFRRLTRLPIEEQIDWLKKEQKALKDRISYKYQQKLANITQEANKHKLEKRKVLEKQYQSKVDAIELAIKQIQQRRSVEEKKLRNAKEFEVREQLRKFSIRANATDIFDSSATMPDIFCDFLERNGINTAADIVDIDNNGQIQTVKSQKHIKVPFITVERGNELKRWIKKLKQQVGNPADLTPAERQDLSTKFNTQRHRTEIAQLKQTHRDAIDELMQNNNIDAEKARLKKAYEDELITANKDILQAIETLSANQNDYETKRETIEAEYNSQHDLIMEKCKTFSENTKSEIERINNRTYLSNKAVLDQTVENIKKTTSQRDLDAILNFNKEQKRLNDLQREFDEVKLENESYRNITFEEFLKKAILFK